jgi:hypothetical protein
MKHRSFACVIASLTASASCIALASACGNDASLAHAGASDGGLDDLSAPPANEGAPPNGESGDTFPCSPLAGVGSIYYSRRPVLLPDGTTKTDGELWVVSGDGSSDTKIGDGEDPRLSPDKQWLLFVRDNVNWDNANLYVRNMSGTGAQDTMIFSNDDYVVGFDWRADSTNLVFDYKCDIHTMKRDGTGRVVLIDYREADCYTDAPAINRVDGRVAWHNFFDGLGVANADGTRAQHVPNTFAAGDRDGGVTAGGDFYPTWTLDGQWLVFLHMAPLGSFQLGPVGTLYKIKPDGSARMYLTPGLNPSEGFFHGGAISPDGSRYIGAGVYHGTNGIYSVPLDGSGSFQRVCTAPGAPIDYVGSVLP